MYALGIGVVRDRVLAYAWAGLAMDDSRAACRRYRRAEDLHSILDAEMSPEQLQEARHLAEGWSRE
jgi:hypothetical protein